MSESSKYAKNGVCKFEDFEENVAAGVFPRLDIVFGWYITLKVRDESSQVYPYISCRIKPELKIRAFFNIKSKFWSLSQKGSIHLESDVGVSGPSINIQDVLNEENGYLENGALTVEYGFHVEGILGDDGIWMFIFQNRIFDDNNSTISFHNSGQFLHQELYCPKLLLTFHSSLFTNEWYTIKNSDRNLLNNFLQVANGVRLKLEVHDLPCIIELAHRFGLRNIVQYCDQMLVQHYSSSCEPKYELRKAILFNMKHSVAQLIEQCNFVELLDELRGELNKIPGVMMKMIIRRFISEDF